MTSEVTADLANLISDNSYELIEAASDHCCDRLATRGLYCGVAEWCVGEVPQTFPFEV